MQHHHATLFGLAAASTLTAMAVAAGADRRSAEVEVPLYAATEMPNLVNPVPSFGQDLNDHGVVVGVSQVTTFGDMMRPWKWDRDNGMINLFPFAGLSWFASATAINNNGEILGYYTDICEEPNPHPECPDDQYIPFGGLPRAVVWSGDGSGQFVEVPSIARELDLVNLGVTPGAISNDGVIGGGAGLVPEGSNPTDLGITLGYLWDQEGDPIVVEKGARSTDVSFVNVASINDHGQYCGAVIVGEELRGYVYDPDNGFTILPRLSEDSMVIEESPAVAINNDGQVIGNATLIHVIDDIVVFEPYGAYIWDAENGMQEIGLYTVYDINDDGWVVGSTAAGVGGYAATLYDGNEWHELQPRTNIDPQNWQLGYAISINKSGAVLVNAYAQTAETILQSGEVQPFLLEPIIEPSVEGDLNDDGVINVTDLLLLLGAWGACPTGGQCPGDLDGDGAVGVTDLLIQLSNWG